MDVPNPFVSTLKEWIEVLMRASMGAFVGQMKESGLSMSQIGALIRIHKKNICGISEIGSELGISSAAASQMIDRLVQQGFISRSEDPHDRRVKNIELTDKVRLMFQSGPHNHHRWLEDLSALLSPAEQEQVIASLRLLIEKAHQLEKPSKRSDPAE